MVCLDVSKSMLAEDVAPNRLERAKAELNDLLTYLSGDQVGLIAFAGRAALLSPLTPDFGFLRLVLDEAGPHSVTRGGTRLEEPIRQPIAGLTARPALFCLERLAWDHGMRVVYHAEHTRRADNTFAHVARMPVPGLNTAELAAQGDFWSEHVARVLVRLAATSAVARGPSTACTAPARDDTATVFSWMISPASDIGPLRRGT
jgi:hypothetical protein